MFFQFGMYKEYSGIVDNFQHALEFFIPNIEIDYKNKELTIGNITITNDI